VCGVVAPFIAFLATKPFEFLDDHNIVPCEATVPFSLLTFLMAYIGLYMSYPSQKSTQGGKITPDLLLFSIPVIYFASMIVTMVRNENQMDLSHSEVAFTAVVMVVSLLGFASGTSVFDTLLRTQRKQE
jgi:hypothetical protein